MGASATGFPLIPSGYIAGTITISAGQASAPQELLALIQAQLDPNCPGVGRQLTISIDTTQLYGGQKNLVGTLSTTNYGFTLTTTFPSRVYGSFFPGSQAPIGDIQIFMAAGTFHVEVLA